MPTVFTVQPAVVGTMHNVTDFRFSFALRVTETPVSFMKIIQNLATAFCLIPSYTLTLSDSIKDLQPGHR